jgi:D-amino-acid oxidase
MKRLPDFQSLDKTLLPAGYKTGWRYRVPIVDMPVYLDHLSRELLLRNVKVEFLAHPLARLDDAGSARLAIVNCTGLGAQEIVPDPTMIPIWGQLVVVDNPGITDFFADHGESDEPVYFMPQGDQVVLGGVVYAGHGPPEPDPVVARGIVARCAEVEPRLATAPIRAHRIGVRPGRAEVRLEREQRAGRTPVIHNYGHGGSGVTVSWGCAMDVLRIIKTI